MKKTFAWTTMLMLVLASGVFAQSLGTVFTYQGKLNDGGSVANGIYDLEFKLFKGLTSGSQVGITNVKEDVNVYDGHFTVSLDFGNMAYLGDPRYLEIGVRPYTSTGAFTTLSPRQLVAPTPYALYAEKSNWNSLEHMPSDIADGDDNTMLTESQVDVYVADNGYLNSGSSLNWLNLYNIPIGFVDGIDNVDDADWTISGSNMYSAVPGNVGIGTSSPSHPLDVNGIIGSNGLYGPAYLDLKSEGDIE
ncbi:MAG: hypothetical protein GY869_16995, partial [Planctomycetes bacterium]|nr:hypothetical protein [Planctomycetota bacterium]